MWNSTLLFLPPLGTLKEGTHAKGCVSANLHVYMLGCVQLRTTQRAAGAGGKIPLSKCASQTFEQCHPAHSLDVYATTIYLVTVLQYSRNTEILAQGLSTGDSHTSTLILYNFRRYRYRYYRTSPLVSFDDGSSLAEPDNAGESWTRTCHPTSDLNVYI